MALLAAALLAAPAAQAATPGQIYKDYADNGRLDRNYSSADIKRALNDALVQGYGRPGVISGLQGEATGHGTAPIAATRSSGLLPFTGLDLALFFVCGAALVLFGVSLRRVARRKI